MIADQLPQLRPMRLAAIKLEQQALLEVTSPNAGWIHALHHRQALLKSGQFSCPECLRIGHGRPAGSVGRHRVDQFLKRHRQITVGVQIEDHLVGRLSDLGGKVIVGQLIVEVVEERLGPVLHVGHGIQVAVRGLVDATR